MGPQSPSLDTWTSFFLLAAGQGLFLAIMLFFNRRGNHKANIFLGLFILCFALTLIDYVGYWSRYHHYFPYFAAIHQPLAFLFGPFLLFYFRSIESPENMRKRDWLHFVPFGLFVIYRLPYFAIPFASKVNLLQGTVDEVARAHLIFPYYPLVIPTLIVLHLAVYAVVIHFYLKKAKRQTLGRQDEHYQIRRRWYRLLQGLYLGFVAGFLFYYILVRTPYFTLFYDYSISLAMTVFIYTVGFLGYKQPEIFSGTALKGVFLAPKYQNSSLTPNASQSLLEKVVEYVETEKPYLDNDLRLNNLAEQLDISIHHLSQVINEQLGKTFSDFINEYRIRAACKILADPKQQDVYIINIAYDVGFNNKTSFNKAFKQYTGLSPSAYRKKQLQSTVSRSPLQ